VIEPLLIARSRMGRLAGDVRRRLGPLGWGVFVVFCIARCSDITFLVAKFILGRSLTSIDFGAVEPVLSVMLILSLPILTINTVAAKSISRLRAAGREEERRALITDMLKITVGGSILGFVVVLALRDFILSRLFLASGHLVWIIAAMCAMGWWNPFCVGVMRGDRRYGMLAIPYVVGPLVTLALTIVLVLLLERGLVGALAAQVAGVAVAFTLTVAALLPDIRQQRRPYAQEWRVMRGGIAPVALSSAAMMLFCHFDRLFVRNFMPFESGGYGAVMTLGAIPSLMTTSIFFVLLPLASAEHAAGRDVKRYLNQALALGLAITTCCVVGFCAIGEWAFRNWNEAFVPYAGYLPSYALSMGLHGIIATVCTVEMARHHYGFVWVVLIPATAMCATMYLGRELMTLGSVIWIVVATRIAVLLTLLVFVALKTIKARKPANGESR